MIENGIIVVGSANLEQLVELADEERLSLGGKHLVTLCSSQGGSGVNLSRRLLATGHPVLPVLTMGEDSAGEKIVDALEEAAEEGGHASSLREAWASVTLPLLNVETPTSVILVHRTDRTVFRQRLATQPGYLDEVRDRIRRVQRLTPNLRALVLGHLPSGDEDPVRVGETLLEILAEIPENVSVHSVLGGSQLKLGWRFWEDALRHRIDLFQLNIEEAQAFFADGGNVPPVADILRRLWDMKLTAVLTMDRFGALATHSASRNLFVAWPLIRADDVVDSTGAGDAFAAGMVAVLAERGGLCNPEALQSALRVGSQWAAAACTTLGGSGTHPAAELDAFLRRPETREDNTEVRRLESAAEILNFIDLAFQPR